jgi:hypothetical protein
MDTNQILKFLEGRWKSNDKTAFLFSETSNWSTLTITLPNEPAFHREFHVIERNGKNYQQIRKDENSDVKEAPVDIVHYDHIRITLDGKQLIINRQR